MHSCSGRKRTSVLENVLGHTKSAAITVLNSYQDMQTVISPYPKKSRMNHSQIQLANATWNAQVEFGGVPCKTPTALARLTLRV